jgi:adenosylcobinamide-GDP ribazoletransferase
MAPLLLTSIESGNGVCAGSCRIDFLKEDCPLEFRDFIDDIARSVAFLSRVHVPQRHFVNYDGRLSRAVRAFPIAGVLVSLPAAAVFSVFLAFQADGLLAAFACLAIQTMITGALHDDGLSDTADGLGGGKDRETALSIMRDSRIGSYGAVALILAFGLRASALAAIARHLSPTEAGVAVLAVAAISRSALVWHWSLLPPARKDGVAASVGEPEANAAYLAYLTGALFAIVLLWQFTSLFGLAASALAVLGFVYLFSTHVREKIGGHTGDTLGASLQIAEIAMLVALAVLM